MESESLYDVVQWISTGAQTGRRTRLKPHGPQRALVAPPGPQRVADHPSDDGASRRGRHRDAPEAVSRDRDAGGGGPDRAHPTPACCVPRAHARRSPESLLPALLTAPGAVV